MITPNQIREYVERNPGLVTRRESTRYPGLFVLKYHRRVFYKNLWTPELQEMRGMVVDADYNVVVYPFTKVYNRGENGTDFDLDTSVVAVQKINGFMAAATLTGEHGLIISTTGSLDSDFADMAAEHIGQPELLMDYTYLFEICDERDPHIIAEKSGAYLIGMRHLGNFNMMTERVLDDEAGRMGFLRPDWNQCSFQEVLDSMPSCKHEGYMVYDSAGNALKLKSPYYLTNKLLARIRETKLDTWLRSGEIKKIVDEEYYPLVNYVQENKDRFVTLEEQERLEFMKEFINAV
jgi:hypothetical protein